MNIEPYRYANGEAHGAEPAKTPDEATLDSSLRPPRRATNPLALRARRSRNDPLWAGRSEASKRLLLEIDRREALL